MEWVKLSSRYYLDPAVASLPDADAEVAFVRGLAYAGAQENGGFIPESIVPSLFRRRRYQAAVEALVATSLWLPCQGHRGEPGYRIARWEDWQEELEAIARRRAADRERKRKERDSKKKEQLRGVLSRDVSMDSPGTEKEIEKIPLTPAEAGGHGSRCTRHKARPKRWCEDCQAPPPSLDSPCGECGPGRLIDHGDHMARCPRCHPLRSEAS